MRLVTKKVDRFIGLREICERTGLDKSTIYRNSEKGNFPQLLEITPGRTGLLESMFDTWMLNRPPAQKPLLKARLLQARLPPPVPAEPRPEPASAAPKKRGRPRKPRGKAEA